jgi:hypothetical protein
VFALVGAGVIHKFDGNEYELVLATDVANNVTILECHRRGSSEQRKIVMDACRTNSTGRIAFSAYEKDTPMDLIIWFVDEANLRLRESMQ